MLRNRSKVFKIIAAAALLLTVVSSVVVAQSARTFLERRMWYVDADGRIADILHWRIVLGNHEVTLRRRIVGHGEIPVESNMMFQMISSGYIEGVGHSQHGRVGAQPAMMLREAGGQGERVLLDSIAYIYDYGTKVVMRNGRRGDFYMHLEGRDLDIPRFGLTTLAVVGEELRVTSQEMPIVAIAFSQEFAQQAAAEPRSE